MEILVISLKTASIWISLPSDILSQSPTIYFFKTALQIK